MLNSPEFIIFHGIGDHKTSHNKSSKTQLSLLRVIIMENHGSKSLYSKSHFTRNTDMANIRKLSFHYSLPQIKACIKPMERLAGRVKILCPIFLANPDPNQDPASLRYCLYN